MHGDSVAGFWGLWLLGPGIPIWIIIALAVSVLVK